MSNEDLAILAKSGEKEYIIQLWQQCERFILMKAKQYYNNSYNKILEIDELKDIGYFALLDAVDYFKPQKGGKFLTVLTYFLSKHFEKAITKKDAALRALSLDEQLGDDDGFTLADTLADKNAAKDLENVVDEQTLEYADKTISDACKAVLSPLQNEVLYKIFFKQMDLVVVAASLNVTKQDIARVCRSAFTRLRHCSYTQRLRELLEYMPEDFNIYSEGLKHTGITYYKQTGYSSVERAAEMHELVLSRRGH